MQTMPFQEDFVGKVRLLQGKYFDIQIPKHTAELLKLKKGTLVRVTLNVVEVE